MDSLVRVSFRHEYHFHINIATILRPVQYTQFYQGTHFLLWSRSFLTNQFSKVPFFVNIWWILSNLPAVYLFANQIYPCKWNLRWWVSKYNCFSLKLLILTPVITSEWNTTLSIAKMDIAATDFFVGSTGQNIVWANRRRPLNLISHAGLHFISFSLRSVNF